MLLVMETKKLTALVLTVTLTSILFLGCLGSGTQDSPNDLILGTENISPGDWKIIHDDRYYVNWDRQGGYWYITRTFEWSDSTLGIEIIIYGIPERAEKTFPIHGPSHGIMPVEIQIGDEGVYWISSSDFQYVHYRKDGALVYSWLDNPDHQELDMDWFISLMRLQASKI